MFLINLICYIFTAYFVAAVGHETYNDLKGEPTTTRWAYARKFLQKFWSNFVYKLP